jgi:hypothetical protein
MHARTPGRLLGPLLGAVALVALPCVALAPRALASSADSLSATYPARVFVEAGPGRPGTRVYRFLVINDGPSPITGLEIGYDRSTDRMELLHAPIGWDGTDVPRTSFATPPGWGFAVIRAEEDSALTYAWQIGAPDYSVWSGSRLSGFSVTLDHPDTMLEAGHWTILIDGSPAWASGRLERVRGSSSARAAALPPDSTVSARIDFHSSSVRIDYEMVDEGPARVVVLDRDDKLVKALFDGSVHAGKNTVNWDGKDSGARPVAAGVYTVRVTTPTGDHYAKVSWIH